MVMHTDLIRDNSGNKNQEEEIMMNTDQEIITSRNPPNVVIERPNSTSPEIHPVNGNYGPEDEDDDEDEEDLILGDDDEAVGDEEEFEVELDEDIDVSEMDDDDLVIDPDDDDDEDDDL